MEICKTELLETNKNKSINYLEQPVGEKPINTCTLTVDQKYIQKILGVWAVVVCNDT